MPSSNSWLSRHRNGAFYTLALILVATLVCGGVTAAVHWGIQGRRPARAAVPGCHL